MAQGKDPEAADGLGGVHKVTVPRASAAPAVAPDPDAPIVGHGPGAADAHLVDDPDQIAKVVHTIEAPIEPPSKVDARESTLRPMQTPQAPLQDARVVPDAPSAWSAEKQPRDP